MPAAPANQKAPRPQEVFISYSRKDKAFVRRLDEELKRRDREAWVDWEGIPPGDKWEKTIYGAIEATHTFIFVLTPDSIASEVCGKEIAHAAANNKRLVPIVHRDVAADRVPKSLGELNWIFCRDSDDFEKATDTLISALDTDLNWVRAHTRLLTRAIEWENKGKNNSFVLRGEDLRSAERWLAEAGAQKERQPTALQTEYIIASRKAAARRQRITLGAVTFGLVVAIVLAIVALFARQDALKQEAKAKEQTKRTGEAASRANVTLARQSKEGGNNAQALAYLAQALRLNPENREASGLTAAMLTQLNWHVPLTDPMRHHAGVRSAQFSPDGQRVLTVSEDNAVRVWDALSGKPISEPMMHKGMVNAAQFSPDGQRVVTASEDKTARLWDAAGGKPIGEPMKHESRVLSAQFSPDGQRVVTAEKAEKLWLDKTVRLWDAASGKPVGELVMDKGSVRSAQFSPNGQWVVTASQDKTALWDAASGKPVGEAMQHEGMVNSAQFSPDGERVVTASDDKTVRLWDAASGQQIGEPMTNEGKVYSAQFSPDGQRVVTVSENIYAKVAADVGAVRLWDALSRKPIGEPMGHKGELKSVQFSPDGQRVMIASGDKFGSEEKNTAQLRDAASGKPIGEPMGHKGELKSAQFSPDGQRVVTASGDHTARLWDATSGKPIGEPMKHGGLLNSAQFSPDGQRVATASADTTAQLWDAASGKAVGEPVKPVFSARTGRGSGRYRIHSAQFSPDGQRVMTAADTAVRLWEAASGKPIGKPMEHRMSVTSAQFSPDGQRVLTASGSAAQLWDAASGKPIGKPMEHKMSITSAQFTPDGQRVVTVSWVTGSGASVRLWDAASCKPIGEPMKLGKFVGSVQFSPAGQRVATSEGNTVRLWDAASGKPIGKPMEHKMSVTSAQFNPDGQRVVTISGWKFGSEDSRVQLWDAGSGKPIGEPMRHEGEVKSAQFSPDGQRMVTASGSGSRWELGSKDNRAQLWDAGSGKPIGEPMRHEGEVKSAQFSPDGQRVVTAADTTVRLWDAGSGKPIGESMKHEDSVTSVQFSPDGQRVVTASADNTVRLWDAVIATDRDTREDILLLAELAEATGGVTLETVGQAENLKLLAPEQIRASREKIATRLIGPSSKMTPLQRFLKWSVSDRRNRTISPLSQVTVAEWLENRIREGTVEGLRAALQVDPADARVTAHLGRVLADEALRQGGDPDEARRARGEADFLTIRALKLAPDNDEVKKLRDEVVELLGLKTN
jgi:WD40 repeat protein